MIVNTSYPDKKRTQKINKLVGKPFSLFERLKMRGIGSPRLQIIDASPAISDCFRVGNGNKHCNIELRPQGLILWFRVAQETFAWAIPFFHLSIFKSLDYYTIHGSGNYAKIKPAYSKQKIDTFIQRLIEQKNN